MGENELKSCPICTFENPELITRGNEFTKKRSAEIKCKNCGLSLVVGAIKFPLSWAIKTVSDKWNDRSTPQTPKPYVPSVEAVIEECAKIAEHQKTICGLSRSRQSTSQDIADNIRMAKESITKFIEEKYK